MMKSFFTLLLMIISSPLWAERFEDHIHSVSEGKSGEEHLLYLISGRVIFVDQSRPPYYHPDDFKSGDRVELEVDEKLTLVSLTSLPPQENLETGQLMGPEVEQPTVLASHENANRIFRGMNRSYKQGTECSDRAHIWAYEEWKKNSLISNKVFLFFTNTYIRRYRFYWWFHVSPYTLVRHDNGQIIEHVLDRKYTSFPTHMKSWTDVFIRSKRTCPVSTYRHYRENKNGPEHCFLVKTSMFYRLPYHVRLMEDRGVIKTRFSQGEVNFSYRAFTRREAR